MEAAVDSSVRVQLPDGSVREVPSGTTPLEIATAISPRLASAVVVARVKPMAGLDINAPDGC
jgi:threonyl-tRNA synthetase